jgi:hypothetical protein
MLCAEGWSEAAERTRLLASAKPIGRCELTREKTFLAAFRSILFSTGRADRVDEIVISRRDASALIRYRNMHSGNSEVSTFGKAGDGIRIQAVIATALLVKISNDVQAMVMEEISHD